MAKIMILGTSHISPKSIKETSRKIKHMKPDCVAIELDESRYAALTSKERKAPSIRNPLYFLFFNVQQYLGKKTGISPGSEMIEAIKIARSVHAKVALIDRNIEDTLNEIKKIPLRERMKLVFKMIFGMFFISGKNKEFDLKDVPDRKMINDVTSFLKEEFPGFYKVLITDRNKYMAEQIKALSEKYDKILVIVGAGHKKGIKNLIKK